MHVIDTCFDQLSTSLLSLASRTQKEKKPKLKQIDDVNKTMDLLLWHRPTEEQDT